MTLIATGLAAGLLTALSFGQTAAANKPYFVSPDLREVSNLKSFMKAVPLAKEHRTALAKNLFFTCPSKDKALYWLYGGNDYLEIPSIVTSDNVLQIGHIFFDSSLRTVEQQKLYPELKKLTDSLLQQTAAQLKALKGTNLEAAATRNAAYFGVARSLLGSKSAIPKEAKALVAKELARIKTHQGFFQSGLFPFEVDYSQFVPRGHYTKTPTLGRYFQAMMWYGLVPFAVESSAAGGMPRPLPEVVKSSLLLVRALENSKASPRWQRIYEATALYAGKSNNLTPAEWKSASLKIFGPKPNVRDFGSAAKIAAFIEEARKLRPSAIAPKRFKNVQAGPLQLRFMGQRAIPDSRVLQELSDPGMRPFPSPLDVMACLGSDRARQLLDANPTKYNPKGWKEYATIRKELAKEFDERPDKGWREDLYWSWLNCLRSALKPAPSGYPSFMVKPAWTDKSLYSALASWSELRHDTVLYGFQSASEGGSDEPPPDTRGYVEPALELYLRLTSFVKDMRAGLKNRGFLSSDLEREFRKFEELLAFFVSVSQRELTNKPLSKKEHERIRTIEWELESLHNTIQVLMANYQQLSEDDLDIAVIADVHTAYGQALEVGVGRADHLVAVVPIEGKLYLARGTAFSYYEFLQPISNRLTDQTWKARLKAGKAPPRPDWVRNFHVPRAIRE